TSACAPGPACRLARRRRAGRPNESCRSRPGRRADDDGKIGVSARANSRARLAPSNLYLRIFHCTAMSVWVEERTLKRLCPMSALPPKADIGTRSRDVRFLPEADSCGAAIDATLTTDIAGFFPVFDVG